MYELFFQYINLASIIYNYSIKYPFGIKASRRWWNRILLCVSSNNDNSKNKKAIKLHNYLFTKTP